MLHRTRRYFVQGVSNSLPLALFTYWKAFRYIRVKMPQLFLTLVEIKKQPLWKEVKIRETLRPLGTHRE